jgi:hypothetical protein
MQTSLPYNLELLEKQLKTAPLSSIASIIKRDWGNTAYSATPYLRAMFSLGDIRENYFADHASDIVLYFLSNASSWRGGVARLVKAELKARLEELQNGN